MFYPLREPFMYMNLVGLITVGFFPRPALSYF